MTLLAGNEPTDPTPAAAAEANPSAMPTDGNTPPASTQQQPAGPAKGQLVRLETSWPYPSVQYLLVVDVDDRGWIRAVQTSAPTGFMPPDSVSAD